MVPEQARVRRRSVVSACGRTPLLLDARTPWPRCAYFVHGMGRSAHRAEICVPRDGRGWQQRKCKEAHRRSVVLARRFAVERMSEAPVVTPLTPLGDFVTELGRMPERERVTTYLARLREHVRALRDAPSACCHSLRRAVAMLWEAPAGHAADAWNCVPAHAAQGFNIASGLLARLQAAAGLSPQVHACPA